MKQSDDSCVLLLLLNGYKMVSVDLTSNDDDDCLRTVRNGVSTSNFFRSSQNKCGTNYLSFVL